MRDAPIFEICSLILLCTCLCELGECKMIYCTERTPLTLPLYEHHPYNLTLNLRGAPLSRAHSLSRSSNLCVWIRTCMRTWYTCACYTHVCMLCTRVRVRLHESSYMRVCTHTCPCLIDLPAIYLQVCNKRTVPLTKHASQHTNQPVLRSICTPPPTTSPGRNCTDSKTGRRR